MPLLPLLGVDFTCAPSRVKPITVARGHIAGGALHVDGVTALASLAAFEALLREPGPWLGAFDFPFGLPRAFVDALGLGTTADAVVAEVHRRCPTRLAFRALIDAFGNEARAAGRTRLPHRRTDGALPGGLISTSPLQTRYVPVGLMYYEGFSRLVQAGVTVPGLSGCIAGRDPSRTALEGYPRLLAHALVGRRSYKNSAEPSRRDARREIVAALEAGPTPSALALRLAAGERSALLDDASGDRLDAVLCLLQAAVAGHDGIQVPATADPLEGWIVGTVMDGAR